MVTNIDIQTLVLKLFMKKKYSDRIQIN